MNEITASQPVSAQTLEHVLGTGDLSKLSTQQRVEYYAKTCQSLGLNPLTRPMRFLSLNGQIQLYFTRDGTDQLRKAQGITLHIVDKLIDSGLFTVTVRARAKDGREDEDIGAVVLPSSGESRANALMKAMTKAKRRVTLSICGLGQTDESELDTMPGAQVFDAEDDLPVAPIRAAAAPMPRGARVAERAPAYEAPPKSTAEPNRPRTRREFLDGLAIALRDAQSAEEVDRIVCGEEALRAKEVFQNGHKEELDKLINAALKKWWNEPPPQPEDDELPEVEIIGADKIAAG